MVEEIAFSTSYFTGYCWNVLGLDNIINGKYPWRAVKWVFTPREKKYSWKISGGNYKHIPNVIPQHFYRQLLRFPFEEECSFERVLQYAYNLGSLKGSGYYRNLSKTDKSKIAYKLSDLIK